jgi:hypothetical protein
MVVTGKVTESMWSAPADVASAMRLSGVLSDSAHGPWEATHLSAGLMSEVLRVKVAGTDRGSDGRPSFVVKQESKNPETAQLAARLRMPQRECGFYAHRHVLKLDGVRAPACYYSANGPGSRFLIVLEDVRDVTQPDQLVGCDEAAAEATVAALAALHAATWDAANCPNLRWCPRLDDPRMLGLSSQYRERWPRFVEEHGDRLPPESLRVAERFGERMVQVLKQWSAPSVAVCLNHGDARADNVMVKSKNHVAILVDWQLAIVAPGAGDLAHFLCGSLTSDFRASAEHRLLDLYFSELRTRGITNYSREQLTEEYRRCLLLVLPLNVIFGTAPIPNERGGRLRETVLARYFQAIVDLSAGEFV